MSEHFFCIGVDIFIWKNEWKKGFSDAAVEPFKKNAFFDIKGVSNRGTRIWPGDRPSFELTDLFRLRFLAKNQNENLTSEKIMGLLEVFNSNQLNWVHIEKLHRTEDKNLFSEMQ